MATQDPVPPHSTMARQFLRYACAGALGTACHFGVLIALVQLVQAGAIAASTAGAVVGALVNYAFNRRYTFASGKTHSHALPRFALVAAAGIVLNALVMMMVLSLPGSNYLVAQVVASGAVLALGYLANRGWTF